MEIANFISAKLLTVRLVNESAKTSKAGLRPAMNLQFADKTSIEVRWETIVDARPILAVIHNMHTVFTNEEKIEILQYEAQYDVRFEILGHTGFEPTNNIPNDAVAPYVDMSSWLAREKAVNTIRSMGLTNFSWPNGPAAAAADPVPQLKAPEKKPVKPAPASKAKPAKATPKSKVKPKVKPRK